MFGSFLKTQNIPPKNQHNHSKLRIWSQNYTQSTLPGTPKGDPNLSKIVTKSSLSRRGAPTGDFQRPPWAPDPTLDPTSDPTLDPTLDPTWDPMLDPRAPPEPPRAGPDLYSLPVPPELSLDVFLTFSYPSQLKHLVLRVFLVGNLPKKRNQASR